MTTLYILLAVALVVLIVLVILFFYLRKKNAKAAAAQAGEPAAAGGDEVSLLVRAAEAKLSAAKIEQGAKIGSLPVYVLMGQPGSTKTSVMIHSGLDPELLAGQVYQNADVVPTRAANLWFSRRSIFAEAGGALLADSNVWTRFVRKLQPRSSVVGKGAQAPRAALVCFDAETFTRAGAQEAAVNAGRTLRARLGEISQALGINLPVYVLFTKMDRLPFFTEYVRNLSNDESTQVLGATVPLLTGRSEGVYAEEETARLSGTFERLFRSLADARPEFLARETDATKLPATYEFPREFRKIRPAVVQFLVDLCRPSQLSVGPMLRGFYFTGVRPILVNEAAPVAAAAQQQQGGGYGSAAGATGIFSAGGRAQVPQATAPRVGATRKVPQWLFLSHLFTDILLADRAAMGASGASTKTSFARRLLFLAAAVLCLVLSICFTVSFFKNRRLVTNVSTAAQGFAAADIAGADLASTSALRKLETLRQSVETLLTYHRKGAPTFYRLGLYIGEDIYPEALRIYLDRFRQLLFAQTQAAVVQSLRGLPSTPPGPEFSPTYDALKAYLITTSNHEHSTAQFLTPVLMKWWANNRTVDPDRQQLAQKQFDFYADILKDQNPYSTVNDSPAIEKARRYLNQLGGTELIYNNILADANKSNPPINFNLQFKDSAKAVLEPYIVPGAYSKGGWGFMSTAIQHPEKYYNGEKWVLGDQPAANIDPAKLSQDLRARYNADFINRWKTYIKSASVVRYAGLADASQKLMQISGNQSPLLELFALASQNTDVDDPNVKAVFQPVQTVVPPASTDRYIQPPNQNYINALVTLQASLEAIAGQGGNPPEGAANPTLQNATQAKVTTRQMAQAFRIDAEGHIETVTQTLLEDPIVYVESLLRALGPQELNANGKGLCTQFHTVMAKYPFNPKATAEATVDDVNRLLRKPNGALWAFYDASVQKLMVKQGSQYVAGPAGGVNPAFLRFFNNAAAFSDALYADGAQDPHFKYTLQPQSSGGYTVNLSIDGQSISYSGTEPAKQFTWQAGGAHGLKASYKKGGSGAEFSTEEGLWAVFHFFDTADRWTSAGAEFNMKQNNKTAHDLDTGQPIILHLGVDTAGVAAAFRPGYFNSLACVADVAK